MAFVLLLAASGCPGVTPEYVTTDASPVFVDGGAPDLVTTQHCADIRDAIDFQLAGYHSCNQDGDCAFVMTACGLDGMCGQYANRGADGPALMSLLQKWESSCVDASCVCPVLGKVEAGCYGGVCGPKAPPGIIGDPCKSGADCASHECVSNSQLTQFPGGYCTVTNCQTTGQSSGLPCPAGATCKAFGTRNMCVRNCDTTTQSSQCRVGYSCCGGPGPLGGDQAWCVPSGSFYCAG